MPFPEFQRILFQRNPLDQVICQLRFPPILKIDTELPVKFQEQLRQSFPSFAEASEWNIEIPSQVQGKLPPELVRQILQTSGTKNYEFSSEDGLWKVNLTRNFLALSAKRYGRWEQFKEKLNIPTNALVEAYTPTYFSRIGLRYINIIKRSALGLDEVPWKELLQPYLAGLLGAHTLSDQVKDFESKYELELTNGEGILRIVTKFVQDADTGETCYLIDSDFYIDQKTEIDLVMNKLNYFNRQASRLIQWSISDRLRTAMEPETL